MNKLIALFQIFFVLLVGSTVVMAFILVFSMMTEFITGVDIVKDYIRPLFGH